MSPESSDGGKEGINKQYLKAMNALIFSGPGDYVCLHAKSLQLCLVLCNPMDCSPPSSSGWGDSPGKNTGMSYHALLQGIFPTQNWTHGFCVSCVWQAGSLSLAPPGKAQGIIKFSKFSHLVMSDSLQPHGLQASLFITNPQSLLKLTSIKSVMPSSHLILCHPLLLLPSIFPSISVFSSESILHIRWPKYWNFSFSISPYEYSGLMDYMSIQILLLTHKDKGRGQKTNNILERVNYSSAWSLVSCITSSVLSNSSLIRPLVNSPEV